MLIILSLMCAKHTNNPRFKPKYYNFLLQYVVTIQLSYDFFNYIAAYWYEICILIGRKCISLDFVNELECLHPKILVKDCLLLWFSILTKLYKNLAARFKSLF